MADPTVTRPWFGYYDSPEQTSPAYDPGESAPCLICGEPWTTDTVRTISIAGVTADRSWFYRIHRACDDAQTPEEAAAREALYVEWMVDGRDEGGVVAPPSTWIPEGRKPVTPEHPAAPSVPQIDGRCPHGFAWEGNCHFCHPEKWPPHGSLGKVEQGCRCDLCSLRACPICGAAGDPETALLPHPGCPDHGEQSDDTGRSPG